MNTVILMGTLGKDVELTTTPNGVSVAKTSMATNKSYKNKEWVRQDQTTWHNLVAWNHTAKFLAQYFKKGSKALITWEISNRSYEAKDWGTRYVSEVIVNQIEFAGWKAESKPQSGKIESDTQFAKKVKEDEISVEDIPF